MKKFLGNVGNFLEKIFCAISPLCCQDINIGYSCYSFYRKKKNYNVFVKFLRI